MTSMQRSVQTRSALFDIYLNISVVNILYRNGKIINVSRNIIQYAMTVKRLTQYLTKTKLEYSFKVLTHAMKSTCLSKPDHTQE